MNKEGSFKPIAIALIISMLIAFFWDQLTFLRNFVHVILDPSAGALLNWNLTWGMLLIVFILTLATTLIQKYTTDQETLRELRNKQKEISKKSQEHKGDPQKMLESQKELGPIMIQTLKLNARSMAYTAIPLILFFRWFVDFFNSIGNPKLFLGLGWFLFYLIFSLIFSSILRKVLKVA